MQLSFNIIRHSSFDITFWCAVWNEPTVTNACQCLFHIASMYKMSHKFKMSCQWTLIGWFWFVLFAKHVERWMAKDTRYVCNTESRYKIQIQLNISDFFELFMTLCLEPLITTKSGFPLLTQTLQFYPFFKLLDLLSLLSFLLEVQEIRIIIIFII